MEISGINSTQTVTSFNTENSQAQTQAAQQASVSSTSASNSESSEETQQIYYIGSEIVSETVFNQYDTDQNGIISESEKAAYEKAKSISEEASGSIDIIA